MGYWHDNHSGPVGKDLVGKCIKTDVITQITSCPNTFPLIQKALNYFTGVGYEGNVQTYLNPADIVRKNASYFVIEFYVDPEDYDSDVIASSDKIDLHISTNIPSKEEFIETLIKFSKVLH